MPRTSGVAAIRNADGSTWTRARTTAAGGAAWTIAAPRPSRGATTAASNDGGRLHDQPDLAWLDDARERPEIPGAARGRCPARYPSRERLSWSATAPARRRGRSGVRDDHDVRRHGRR